MRRVLRSEILDYMTYGERRDELRRLAMEAKDLRRVHVGEHLTFLFENADTIRYQVQEMIRAERIVREADIRHELDTYNELIGGDGEMGATLLVEIEDAAKRDDKLRSWLELPAHVYVELRGGRRVRARHDERQLSRDRLSSVQYLKFATGGEAPIAVGCDHPELTARTELSAQQRATLEKDLAT
jgi:hypothetical protein